MAAGCQRLRWHSTPSRTDARVCGRRRAGEAAPAAIFNAMVAHPEFVAGTDRLDTDLMRVAGTRLFAKVGAEGLLLRGHSLDQARCRAES